MKKIGAVLRYDAPAMGKPRVDLTYAGAEPLVLIPLHLAACYGHTATARLLLDRGAQANAKGYVCALAPRPPLLVLLPVSRRLSSGEKREQTFNVFSFGNRSMIAWSLHF